MESPLRTPTEPDFRLIETFGWHPGAGFRHLDRHLGRMARSAAAFGLPFDVTGAKNCLKTLTLQSPTRCRLVMDRAGAFEVAAGPLNANPPHWAIEISDTPLNASDPFLAHKTTRRALYDETRAVLPKGVDEVLFLNDRGEVAEGTITNIFIETQSGEKLTPPLTSGVLPGILREIQLETEGYSEAVLHLDDLTQAKALYMGNSLRGLIPAILAL